MSNVLQEQANQPQGNGERMGQNEEQTGQTAVQAGAVDQPVKHDKALVFELSQPGRVAYALSPCDVPEEPIAEMVPDKFLRSQPAALPELYEVDVIRHYTA